MTSSQKQRSAFGSIREKHYTGRRSYLEASYSVPKELRIQYGTPYRISKSFPLGDRRLAQAWLSQQSMQIIQGTWLPPKLLKVKERADTITINDYWQEWLKHRTWKGKPLRPGTVYATTKTIQNHILPTLSHVRLRDITQARVDRWLETMPSNSAEQHNAYKVLKAMLRTASQPGIDGTPPIIRQYPITRPNMTPKRKTRTVPATPCEIKQIYDAMPGRYALSIYLAVYCGALRIGEVCALQKGDIDLSARTLSVSRERTTMDRHGVVGDPKTDGSVRTVRIPDQICPLINQFFNQYGISEKTDWLFPAVKNPSLPIHPNSLRSFYAIARHKAGRDDLRFHDLRHTGLTLLAGQGATVRELMDEAGHATPDMAMRYQHEVDKRSQVLADRLGSLITLDTSSQIDQRIQQIDKTIESLEEEKKMLIQKRQKLQEK